MKNKPKNRLYTKKWFRLRHNRGKNRRQQEIRKKKDAYPGRPQRKKKLQYQLLRKDRKKWRESFISKEIVG